MDEPKEPALTPEAEFAIKQFLTKRLVQIGAIVGITSIAALWPLFQFMSGRAVAHALESVESEVVRRQASIDALLAGATSGLTERVSEIGAVGGRLQAVDERLSRFSDRVTFLESIDPGKFRGIAELLGEHEAGLRSLMSATEFDGRIGAIEQRVGRDAERLEALVPVGTLIASMLRPEVFGPKFNAEGTFAPETARWLPADGRPAPGSRLEQLGANVPDLRGAFLRGLDDFANPRGLGEFQEGTVGEHAHHLLSDEGPDLKIGADSDGARINERGAHVSATNRGNAIADISAYVLLGSKTPPNLGLSSLNLGAGAKNRPDNVSVFYYVRAN